MNNKLVNNPEETTCKSGESCLLGQNLIELKNEVDKLSELVSTDTLTGLHNYHYFTEIIAQEIERSQRTAQPTTLIMLDADHFKRVNDQWGHEMGNKALQLIASCIKGNIRKLDIPCRYGGEEFAIILPSTDISTSIQVAERIRHTIESSPLIVEAENQGEVENESESRTESHSIALTISLGISSYVESQKGDNWHKLVERADKELYRAKEQGRNKTCHSPTTNNNEQQVSEDEKSALFDMFESKY
ncbi:MAG: diguanylate cyclase (GGDEF)-like protein [Cellvibrionaceae bacterium]|jgi:diguanylate cyclase (GGDEF)-like protein